MASANFGSWREIGGSPEAGSEVVLWVWTPLECELSTLYRHVYNYMCVHLFTSMCPPYDYGIYGILTESVLCGKQAFSCIIIANTANTDWVAKHIQIASSLLPDSVLCVCVRACKTCCIQNCNSMPTPALPWHSSMCDGSNMSAGNATAWTRKLPIRFSWDAFNLGSLSLGALVSV